MSPSFSPPGLDKSSSAKGELLMVLTVKFDVFENGVNRRKGGASVASGEVHIHRGDSAVRLARDFCKRYGLDESEVALPLAEHIETNMQDLISSPSHGKSRGGASSIHNNDGYEDDAGAGQHHAEEDEEDEDEERVARGGRDRHTPDQSWHHGTLLPKEHAGERLFRDATYRAQRLTENERARERELLSQVSWGDSCRPRPRDWEAWARITSPKQDPPSMSPRPERPRTSSSPRSSAGKIQRSSGGQGGGFEDALMEQSGIFQRLYDEAEANRVRLERIKEEAEREERERQAEAANPSRIMSRKSQELAFKKRGGSTPKGAIHERLYRQGMDNLKHKEIEAARALVERDKGTVEIRDSDLVKGEVVPPFHPDIGYNRRVSRGNAPLLERVDYLGEKKRRDTAVREEIKRIKEMGGCTFKPELSSRTEELVNERRSRWGSAGVRPNSVAYPSPHRRPTTSGRDPAAPPNLSSSSSGPPRARSASPPPRHAQHRASSPTGPSVAGMGMGMGMDGWSPERDAPLTATALGINVTNASSHSSPSPPPPPARTNPPSMANSPPQYAAEVASDHHQQGRARVDFRVDGDAYTSSSSSQHHQSGRPAAASSLLSQTASFSSSSSSSSGVLAQAKEKKLRDIYALLSRGSPHGTVPGDVSSVALLIRDEELASLITPVIRERGGSPMSWEEFRECFQSAWKVPLQDGTLPWTLVFSRPLSTESLPPGAGKAVRALRETGGRVQQHQHGRVVRL